MHIDVLVADDLNPTGERDAIESEVRCVHAERRACQVNVCKASVDGAYAGGGSSIRCEAAKGEMHG